MRLREETITPKRAQEWLDKSSAHHERQRSLSWRRVDKLTHAITSGQWLVTHQAIAISPDGFILDGQHRLAAIVAADQEVRALVAWDADPETFGVIDTGAARTTADTLRIAGYTDTNIRAAAVRSAITYEQIAGTTNAWGTAHQTVTTRDVLDYLDERHEEVDTAVAVGRRVAGSLARYGLNSGISAVALVHMTRDDVGVGPDAQAEFWERLADGVMLPSSSPIMALRRWFLGDTGFYRLPGRLKKPTLVAGVVKCMNDYGMGLDRRLVIYRAGIEPMPTPLTGAELRKFQRDKESALEAREASEGKHS